MSNIITCQCGAKIRLPESAHGRLRCPRCKAELMASVATAAASSAGTDAPIVTTNVVASGTWAACPICQTAIVDDEPVVTCPECDQVHHHDCWTEVGGCGTYGCKKAPELQKEEVNPNAPRAAWGDTKKCPLCGETIKAIALRCRYCGTDFDTVDPLSVKDLHKRANRDKNVKRVRSEVTVLFCCSVIGLLAPLMLLIALVYVPTKHKDIERAGPVYRVLAYAALGLSVLYSILMLVFWLHDQGSA